MGFFRRVRDVGTAVATLERHAQWIGERPVQTRSGALRGAFSIEG